MPKNENKMGKWGATSYIIGNIVGSGIFITPASVLRDSTSIGVALLIWILSAVVAILGAFSYVELGTSIRNSGADYAYLCFVKWDNIAFAFMLCGCLLVFPTILAIQAGTFSEYIIKGLRIEICDPAWGSYAHKAIGFSVVWILLYLNFFSIRTVVARFQIVASGAKIISTGLIIVIGIYFLIFKGAIDRLMNPFAGSELNISNLLTAFFGGLYSYDGWDVLNFGAEDMENPKIALPFAIVVGMTTVTVIFLAINISFFAVLSLPQIQSTNAIATTFALNTLGDFHYIMSFLISIVLIGSLNVTIFSASRYLYAASRSGQFPAFISCINSNHDSPRAALLLHVLLGFGVSFLGNLDQLIEIASFSLFIQRVLTIAALLYIRIWHVPVHPEAIRMPLIIPITYLILTGALIGITIVHDFGKASISLFIIFIGFIIYFAFLWDKSLQRFEAYRKIVAFVNVYTSIAAQIALNGLINTSAAEEEVQLEPPKTLVLSSITLCPHSIQYNPQTTTISDDHEIKSTNNNTFLHSRKQQNQIFPIES